MKKLIALVLALIMMFAFAACASEDAPAEEPNKDPTTNENNNNESNTEGENNAESDDKGIGTSDVDLTKISIGVSWSEISESMQVTLNALTADLEAEGITVYVVSANSSAEKQQSDVEDLISKQCDMIYILPVDETAIIAAIETVKDAGIICGVGRPVDSDALDFRFSGIDYYHQGVLQAEYLATIADANPDMEFNVAICLAPANNSAAQLKRNGFYDTFFDEYGDRATLVVEQDCQYNTEVTQSAVEGWMLSHPEINAIICANDDTAIGASNACIANGREDIIIIGLDGTPTGLSMVKEGTMLATIKLATGAVGHGTAKAIIAYLTGEFEGGVYTMTQDMYYTVTADTVDDWLS